MPLSIDHRLRQIQHHGSDSIAYSTLQPGLDYFDLSFGYLAYRRIHGYDITLGPPICAPADQKAILERFIVSRRKPVFFYIGEETAAQVQSIASGTFSVSGIGVERQLDLTGSLPSGTELCGALRKGARARFSISEEPARDMPSGLERVILQLNQHYLKEKTISREMAFLNRPLVLDRNGLDRLFLLQQFPNAEKDIFGFAVLDPFFRAGRPVGYLLNLVRFRATRLWGVYLLVVYHLAKLLQQEKAPLLSLGFCPLLRVSTPEALRGNNALSRKAEFLEKKFSSVPYLAHLHRMKDLFMARDVQRYLAARDDEPFRILIAFLAATGIPVASWFGRRFLSAVLGTFVQSFRPLRDRTCND